MARGLGCKLHNNVASTAPPVTVAACARLLQYGNAQWIVTHQILPQPDPVQHPATPP